MRVFAPLGLLAAVSVVYAADLTVTLPPGETSLQDIGLYRVGYQSYGGETVWMPDSWVGHFEPVAGISYSPGHATYGRSSLLLHSPWHIAPGKTFVDYRLKLPKTTPITLSFGIAMGPGMTAPSKSDGVTFSVYFTDKYQENELFREHYAKEEWEDQSFDLSICAGETITLRLQVEPGPQNNPSFDYSFWGNPKLTCGSSRDASATRVAQLTASRAYKATENVSLVALSNKPGQGVTPSNLLSHTTALKPIGKGYDLSYQGADCAFTYHYEPQTGTLADVTCTPEGGPAFRPADGGGVIAEFPEKDGLRRAILTGGKPLSVQVAGQTLQVRWQYAQPPVIVDWTFGIVGKALTVQAKCAEAVLAGLSLGHVAGAPMRRMLSVPYLPSNQQPLCYLPVQSLYVCRYLDWTVSNASACPQGEAIYDKLTDGTRNSLLESGYVALSPNVNEVLPNIPWAPSPYLKLLGDRIMLDIWGQHKNSFAGSGENLRDLKDNGVDHLALINHVWQRFGYDVKLPDHIPANPGLGGEEGMIAFGKAANDCRYVWSLHENYIDLYPDAPSYDPSARVLRSEGSPSLAWFNKGTGVQSFGLKCNRAQGFAAQNSPAIHNTYGTNAAYLDVHTCVPPWHQLDHEAGQPLAGMARAKVKYDSELFQYMRDTHGGPLFGEGNNQFYWAGRCDGVEAQVSGGEDHSPFLDLDLLKLHPQMVNHGMGYYERWFLEGYQSRWGRNVGTVADVDKYRAQTVAYGHAGFIGHISTDNIQWVAKEHNLLHPLQALYGTARPTAIQYEVAGKLVGASVALAVGDTSHQRIRYDSGLEVWVNWSDKPWKVGETVLPQWGFVATGPGTRVSQALIGDKYGDYSECPEFLFADARTSFNLPYLRAQVNVEPRLKQFEYLGGNKVKLTYEWQVGQKITGDQHCFVHFTNPSDKDPENTDKIVFQQDHGLPKPTSQWQPGEVLTDGPYEITLPEDKLATYDITIGLFSGPRLSLKGLDDGAQRIVLGRMQVTRVDGKVTDVKLVQPEDLRKEYEEGDPPDFRARLNPAGTLLDFGKLATDGAVKVNRGEQSLTLFPYPRDKAFTVSLDLKAISPKAKIDEAKVSVRALAAGTQADLGPVPVQWEKGRLVVKMGKVGAGRYVVEW